MQQTGTPEARTNAVEITRYVLFSLALAIGSLLLLPFYGLALVALPLPALVATMKHGAGAGTVVAIAASLPVSLLAGPALGGAVLLITLILGVGQALLARAGTKASRLLTLCIGTFILVTAAGTALVLASRLVTLAELETMSHTMQAELARYAGRSVEGGAEAAKEAVRLYVYLLPSGLIVMCLASGLANFLFSQYLLRVRKLPSVSLPPFKEWQIPWYLSWGFLVGLASAVGYRYVGGGMGEVVLYAGFNLIVIFGAIFMVQGFAVFAFFLDRYKAPPPLRVLLLMFAGFLQLFVQAFSWLGLFDTWFNYRKLERKQ